MTLLLDCTVLTSNFYFFRNWKTNPTANFKEWLVCSNCVNGLIHVYHALFFGAFRSPADDNTYLRKKILFHFSKTLLAFL